MYLSMKIWAALLYGFFEEKQFDSSVKGENDITTMFSEEETNR